MAVKSLTKFTEEIGAKGKYRKPIVDRLTNDQLRDLEKELAQFRNPSGSLKINKWLVHAKALNSKEAVIVTNFKPAIYSDDGKTVIRAQDSDPILYEQMMEDLEQFFRWQLRKEYATKKENEAYENMAL